jgi:hypothetical protein
VGARGHAAVACEVTQVPEPSHLTLLAVAVLGLAHKRQPRQPRQPRKGVAQNDWV